MKTHYIYKATNKINGKSYIGQTVNFEHRKHTHIHRRDEHCDPNSIFHKAIDKYGEENFEWEILGSVPGKEFANSFERYCIAVYNTYKPNGYNLTRGGDGGSDWNVRAVVCLTPSGEFVKRYDSAADAEYDGFYRSGVLKSCKNPTSETKGHIFMYEDEYMENGGRAKEEKMAFQAREIYQCDMDGNLIKKFRMISEAEKELGIGHSQIIGCAKGHYRTAGGFIFVYPEDFPIKDIESHRYKKAGLKVAKIDPETGTVLAIYDRIVDAAADIGGSRKVVWKAARGQARTAYGFKWMLIS